MYLTDFQGHSCYFCILVQHPLCRHVAEGIAGSPIPPSALTALALTLTSGTCSQESSSMIQKYPKVRCSMVRKILQGSTGYALASPMTAVSAWKLVISCWENDGKRGEQLLM